MEMLKEQYIEEMCEKYGISDGRNKKLYYNFGINDAKYITVNVSAGWRCPHFTVWQGVMCRGLSEKQKLRNPRYLECSVNPAWRKFSDFLSWSLENRVEGWDLDKDLLIQGNKVYGPETCAYVPKYLNNLIKPKVINTNGFPLGVFHRGGNRKTYGIVLSGKKSKVGYLDPFSAHKDWQIQKAADIYERLVRYSREQNGFRIDVAEALNARLWQILVDHQKDIQTTFS